MRFTEALLGFEGALVGAIRDVFDPQEHMRWGSDYRERILDAVRPIIGELTVGEAYALAELAEARVEATHGHEDSDVAHVAWRAAFDLTVEAMSKVQATSAREAAARVTYFQRHCVDPGEETLLVYASGVLKQMERDWWFAEMVPPAGPTLNVLKGGAA